MTTLTLTALTFTTLATVAIVMKLRSQRLKRATIVLKK
jgi:hypothetical protein